MTRCGRCGCHRTFRAPSATARGAADCELSGPAGDLYLALWNRQPITALTTEGDEKLAELWREHSGI
ncbi:hypothetical protein SANTM175S_04178 [Streptomyces antimycoticus]